jgi:peroxiredoxin
MFLKLPEISNNFGVFGCKTCISKDPYVPLLGSGYFGLLIAISLLFPTFPNPHLARGGLIWALLLALALTYIDLPNLCSACLVGHLCNILIWSIWLFIPSIVYKPSFSNRGMRLCLILFAPVSVVAFFSSLNLTFMVYGFKSRLNVSKSSLHIGDPIPIFTIQTVKGREIVNTDRGGMVLNFVTPECPYCEEQLQVFQAVVSKLVNSSYRFINISPKPLPELTRYSSAIDWVEDKDNILRNLFKIHGYPTMYVVGNDGKIIRVIHGVSEGLRDDLETSLVK